MNLAACIGREVVRCKIELKDDTDEIASGLSQYSTHLVATSGEKEPVIWVKFMHNATMNLIMNKFFSEIRFAMISKIQK